MSLRQPWVVVCLVIAFWGFGLSAYLYPIPSLLTSFDALVATPTSSIVMVTTTSVQATGLLDVLIPVYQKSSGVQIKFVAVGSGKAIEIARAGDADLVLSHSPNLEEKFLADGLGTHAYKLMYNDFLIIGPQNDPANATSNSTALEVLHAIISSGQTFISRGDNSGTHQKELELWNKLGGPPKTSNYIEIGQGMAETLQMAYEKSAYTLCDRSTWLFMRKKLPQLRVIYEKPTELKNIYHVMAVSNAKHPWVKTNEAIHFINWLVASEGRSIIASYTIDGEPLFHLFDLN